MGSSLAGLLILAILLTGSLMIWQVNLAGTTRIHGASKGALQLEGERARTQPSITTAKADRNNNTLAVSVSNNGATSVSVSDLDKMDLVVFYDSAAQSPVRLTYTTTNPPPAGQWTNASISGSFEPSVWNPAEDLTISATLVGATCAPGTVTVGFPNGVTDTSPFLCAVLDLTFHSETADIAGTTYYQLKDETPADGAASTVSVTFAEETTGRQTPASNLGKFVFPLTGISTIPAANWNITYRLKRSQVDGGWIWFTNATDISLGSTGAWTDIDLSAIVPVGTTGVVVEVVNTNSGGAHTGILRSKEDDREYMSNASFQQIDNGMHRWQVVKLDSNRKLQGHISSTNVDFKLIGYTIGGDPIYFADQPPDITPIALDKWSTVDVSNYVSADATGVILLVTSERNGKAKYRIRTPGGTEQLKDNLNTYANTMYFVGLSPFRFFEARIKEDTTNIYLIAETKNSVAHYPLEIFTADPSTGSWQEIDADDYGVPAAANGLILHYDGNKDDYIAIGFRHGDSTDDWNKNIFEDTHYQAAIGLRSSDNVWDEYLGHADLDVSIAAYTKPLD